MKRFPFYSQLDSMDCGPTCLRIISKFYKKTYSLETLREMCSISKDGVSLLGISNAAEKIGFRSMGVKIDFSQLVEEISLPCIVHWNRNHFIVVYKIKKERDEIYVYVSDPSVGLLKYTKEQFLSGWMNIFDHEDPSNTPTLGVALLLEPTPKFHEMQPESTSGLHFQSLIQYILPYKQFIFQLCLAILIGSVISLILPFLTQAIVDVGIGNANYNFVVVILIAQVFLVFGQMANELIQNWLILHMTTRVSISLVSDFLAKLMNLPISFFDKKKVGDIMQRIGDHSRIQTFLTSSLISIIMSIVTFITFSLVMGAYNILILTVFLLEVSYTLSGF